MKKDDLLDNCRMSLDHPDVEKVADGRPNALDLLVGEQPVQKKPKRSLIALKHHGIRKS